MIFNIKSIPTYKEAVLWDPSKPFMATLEIFGLKVFKKNEDGTLEIPTAEGTMKANPGDWIIKGIKGEFYPCKTDVFRQSYELLNCKHKGSKDGGVPGEVLLRCKYCDKQYWGQR